MDPLKMAQRGVEPISRGGGPKECGHTLNKEGSENEDGAPFLRREETERVASKEK